MKTEFITEDIVTEFFLSDPALCVLSLGDDIIARLYKDKKYILNSDNYAQGVFHEDKLVAIVVWSMFTFNTLNMHLYVKSEYHGTKTSYDIFNFLVDFWKEQEWLAKIVVMVPEPCKHVSESAIRQGFILEGQLKNSMIWRQKTVDLLILSYSLKEND